MNFIEINAKSIWYRSVGYSDSPKGEIDTDVSDYICWIPVDNVTQCTFTAGENTFDISLFGITYTCIFPNNTSTYQDKLNYIRRVLKGEVNMGNFKDEFKKQLKEEK